MVVKELRDLRFAKAADVMTKDVIFIDGKETVADAIKLMRKKGVSCLIINRRGSEDAWGIMTCF